MAPEVQAYTTTIGDGLHTQFTIAHHLNTMDTLIEVYDKDRGTVSTTVLSKTPNFLTIDVGRYTHIDTHWRLGPFRIPKPGSRPVPYGPTIPAPDQLQVVVIG